MNSADFEARDENPPVLDGSAGEALGGFLVTELLTCDGDKE